ncbi:hypothetical protein KP509_29G047200 [Ceratopteris richardii]|nr:hypothetical protein KP509_29G047200 [Ceratopteris richardii]
MKSKGGSQRISGNSGSHQDKDGSKTSVTRPGMHFKSSSSLPPLDRSTETFEPEMQRRLRNNLPMQDGPTDSLRDVETDLGKSYDRSRPAGRSRYSRGNPMINSELDSGEPSRDALYDLREFPFHFATKPSSYVPSEPQHSNSSSSPPHTSGSLAKKLTSMSEEEQERAVAELLQLSRVPEKRLSLCSKDILEALLPHLESTNMNVQVNSIKALVNFSIEKSNKVVILRAGAVPFIVKVLENGCPEAQEHAAGAAFSLALSDENKSPMGVLNIIPALINLLDSGPIRAREDATMALYNLSLLHTNKSKLVKGGAIPILFNLAQSKETRPDLVSRVLMVLANAASIPEGKAVLTQLNAIPALVRLLAIKSDRHADMIPEQAAAVLILLSKDYLRFVSIVVKAGAEELLTAMVENGTTRGREKASRLLAIIKESLSEPDESDENSVLSRQYMRMKAEGGMMNSSAF